MKTIVGLLSLTLLSTISLKIIAQTSTSKDSTTKTATKNLYIDVHQFEAGKVIHEDVSKAHAKDLVVEKKYGVHLIKYWLNEEKGLLYCLSSASDTQSIRKTHGEAHGLLPQQIYQVTGGRKFLLINNHSIKLN